jgi:hypothetical protein
MNRTRAGGIAVGMFAVGLLTGLAGTAVASEEATATDCSGAMAEHMSGQDMADMMSRMGGWMGPGMMGPGMMGDQNGSMGPGMMGPGMIGGQNGSMGPGMMGPDLMGPGMMGDPGTTPEGSL